jgi:hypothetical protein
MQKCAYLLTWWFLFYDPAFSGKGLQEVGGYAQEECEQQRFDKYDLLIRKFNGKHNDSWWISPLCHEKD